MGWEPDVIRIVLLIALGWTVIIGLSVLLGWSIIWLIYNQERLMAWVERRFGGW